MVTKPCQRCGTPTTKKYRGNAKWLCIDCACEAVRQAATQISAKRGPMYDKWLAATEAGIAAQRRRAG